MARPLRIQFAGAVYHVTSRGDRREPIYRNDDDRGLHLGLIGQAMERFDARMLAYCLMGNHYHLVLQTLQPNLSRLMRHINGVYTQAYNHRHGLVGHLFQGRYKAILVDSDAYLLAVCRYVEGNPVAAGLVAQPAQWRWSSHRAHALLAPAPAWLDSGSLYAQLLGRAATTKRDRQRAAALYTAAPGGDGDGGAAAGLCWKDSLRQQVFLGDDAFIARMQQQHLAPAHRSEPEIPRAQRDAPPPAAEPVSLQALMDQGVARNEAVFIAYRHHGMTMPAIARELGLSVARVSKLIQVAETRFGVKSSPSTGTNPY